MFEIFEKTIEYLQGVIFIFFLVFISGICMLGFTLSMVVETHRTQEAIIAVIRDTEAKGYIDKAVVDKAIQDNCSKHNKKPPKVTVTPGYGTQSKYLGETFTIKIEREIQGYLWPGFSVTRYGFPVNRGLFGEGYKY